MSEIWIADWTFYQKEIPIIVKAIVTRKLPLRILMANRMAYDRAVDDMERRMGIKFINALDNDKATGLKKFKLEYVRKIGM